MIKELDNQDQEKVTPRKIFNEESGGAGSENSQTSPLAEEVGGYFFGGSSRSRSRSRTQSAQKNQKSVSKKKGISKSHRSARSEARSRSKSKSAKSKPRQPKPMTLTSRITRFRYHRRAKLQPNVQVYEENKDSEDHLSIFSIAAEQEEWPMPVWCKMFRHTLSGSTRNWFDSLDLKSVDGFEELSNKFLEEFSQNKGHRRGKGRSMGTYAPYARREGFTPLANTSKKILAMDNVNFPPTPLMVGTPEKRNINKLCDYHQDRGHNTNDYFHLKKRIKEAVASGRLAHLVKDIRQGGQKSKGSTKGKEKVINMVRSQGYRKRPYEMVEHWMDNAITFPPVPRYQLMNCPVVVEAMIEGFRVRRIHVDGGSSLEVMYEPCFRNFSYQTRLGLRESRILLVGFSGEVSYPMGVIDLEVTTGECGKTRTVIMEFAVVKSPSPYNALLGRTGMMSLGVVAYTIHSMMKFLTSNGIATISTTRETLRECRLIEEAQDLSRHARVEDPTLMQTSSEVANPRVSLAPVETRPWRPGNEPMQLDDMEERRQLDKGRKPPKSGVEEKIVVNDNYPKQLITIRGGMSTECRHALIHTLQKNVDIFAWTPADMTGIPKAITEHSLNIYPHIEPKAQKKRSLASDKRKVVTDEVNEWLKTGIIRRVRYPTWVANPVLVKKVDRSWRMCIDFKDQNKACPKDMYPLPEIDWKIESLMGFQYKCFLDGATYQRMVDSAFKEHIGVNLEAYVDDMVIKSRTEQDIIEDIEQTFFALRRINMKLNPKKCSFDTLKKCTNKKDFRWTKADEAAFLEMMKLVSELPTLTTLKNAEVDSNPRLEDVPESSNVRENLTPGPRAWRLYTDGASNNEGYRAGLVPIAPDDVEYSYALCLNFSNSNNDAEYEALLARLQIAKEMQYREKVLELAGAFNRFRITRIPRAENMKDDALQRRSDLDDSDLKLSREGILPEDPIDARTLMEKIRNYTMEDGVLYRNSYLVPLMRELIKACDDCQAYASVPRLPKADMISVTSAWSFMKWGMDIVGPLSEGPGRVKYLIVATDYFTKWMKAKPLATITDNGTQFVNDPFKKWVEKLKIQLISTSVYHHQGNGAVERANRSLLRGIKTRLEKGGSA
uniref:Reverse transcriptase domain-containing protein n=1 Tax=Tanacetum cinerariifolium TaxID=118510 RepID=A0A6L2LXF9_TANCI|nr:reverse transcriptase domain-containing protein [Tanacetum cinerariifolium]